MSNTTVVENVVETVTEALETNAEAATEATVQAEVVTAPAPVVTKTRGPSAQTLEKQIDLLEQVKSHMVKYTTAQKKGNFQAIVDQMSDDDIMATFGNARTFHGCFMGLYNHAKAELKAIAEARAAAEIAAATPVVSESVEESVEDASAAE